MKVLEGHGPEARRDRPATSVLHDEPNVRVVAFHLREGQEVPMHTSASTVVVSVLEGRGYFRGADGESLLGEGDTVAYAPGEPHGMEAVEGTLRFLAMIAPRP